MEISIQFKNVSKSFNKKLIFSDLSYLFYQRNYHLIGKNGAGKSTLLRLIAGLESPDTGSIMINNQYLVGDSSLNAKQIFYIPDDLAIYPFLTGIEFLSWIGRARTSTLNEINEVIDRLELRVHQSTPIADMSFGTKKKFLLASALIGKPDFIVLDEPLNGLDKHSQCVLLTILKEKASFAGIILTTHHDSNIDLLEPIKIQVLQNKLVEEKSMAHDAV
ncbi:ABC transporter ATP-binding protein [Legionella yabuuchiae]|uniref:ABC transporter ATP-binding protein n=1 Tax=Legionella yabuuchiae TaxID=376727 RepID=UPI0010567D46|nr:ABC transporter ATP-binding protein [Legionella yabuuchiae]